MNISLNNIGPIRKAEFALDKRFYVFVGYNNSGKTYASYILWSLFENNRNRRPFYNNDFSNVVIPRIGKSKSTIVIPEEKITEVVNFYNNKITDELSNVFNTSKESDLLKKSKILLKDDFAKKWNKSKYKAYFADTLKSTENTTEYVVEKISGEDNLKFYKVKYMPITNDMFDKHDIRFITTMRENPETTVQYMVNFIITDCLFDLIQSPFFLPANRIFFPAYFKYIYSTEAKEFQNIRRHLRESKSIDTDSISEYPHTEPVNHLIEAVANLPRREANDYYLDLLEELEQIISGKITFSQKEGIAPVEFKLKPIKGESIDMYLASSSSNQLTMLYLYFKYWARKSYNFLIIDEPEENLHPQNQIKIANILLKFANRDNNKVLITTHSPLLAETINNDMYMSYIKEHQPEETVSKLADDYVIENTLKSEDYGVYFFDGGRTTQYKADSYGIYFKDFAQEETKVREHSDALRARIYTIQNGKQYHD